MRPGFGTAAVAVSAFQFLSGVLSPARRIKVATLAPVWVANADVVVNGSPTSLAGARWPVRRVGDCRRVGRPRVRWGSGSSG